MTGALQRPRPNGDDGPSQSFGRGERIRTSDLSVPNRAHYQAVLRPGLTYQFWNGLFEADPPF